MVKRYGMIDEASGYSPTYFGEMSDGNYVRYSDYAQLERELADIKEALELGKPFGFDPATGFIQADDGGAGEHCVFYVPKAEVTAAEAESDRLAAEVESVREQCVAWAGSYGKKCGEAEHLRRGLETLASTFYKENQHQDYAKHVLDAADRASLQTGDQG